MPKNIKGGNKHKKQKNSNVNEEQIIMLKNDENQDYGYVIKLLGNCRVLLLCNDKQERLGIIRGNMRKRQWINLNNLILYSKREYEDDKVDIIFVYTNEMINNNNELKKIKINKSNNVDNLLEENENISEEEDDIFNLDDI